MTVTTGSFTNYATLFQVGATPTGTWSVIGAVLSIDPPELMSPAVEITNHSSGGNREFIFSGLSELGEFTVGALMRPNEMSTLDGYRTAGTEKGYRIAYPSGEAWRFSALVTSVKMGTADAQSPEAASFEIKFRPTGAKTTESI